MLLPRFIAHRAGDIVTLRRAVEASDFEVVRRIGHNLRGNGPSYGFPQVGEIGRALEEAAEAGDGAAASAKIAMLEAWLASVRDRPTID
jgi:HPt (histidine-containing phosphotransfer) domain-containing protein